MAKIDLLFLNDVQGKVNTRIFELRVAKSYIKPTIDLLESTLPCMRCPVNSNGDRKLVFEEGQLVCKTPAGKFRESTLCVPDHSLPTSYEVVLARSKNFKQKILF
ncbi:MAG: hypothetical protein WC069_02820 [Candidatus Shapirobacteria bacterium]